MDEKRIIVSDEKVRFNSVHIKIAWIKQNTERLKTFFDGDRKSEGKEALDSLMKETGNPSAGSSTATR